MRAVCSQFTHAWIKELGNNWFGIDLLAHWSQNARLSSTVCNTQLVRMGLKSHGHASKWHQTPRQKVLFLFKGTDSSWLMLITTAKVCLPSLYFSTAGIQICRVSAQHRLSMRLRGLLIRPDYVVSWRVSNAGRMAIHHTRTCKHFCPEKFYGPIKSNNMRQLLLQRLLKAMRNRRRNLVNTFR